MQGMDNPRVPTARIVIDWPAGMPDHDDDAFNDYANGQIVAAAAQLREAGQWPALEVWYRNVPNRPDSTEADFDAVVVDEAGVISTLPPYSELIS